MNDIEPEKSAGGQHEEDDLDLIDEEEELLEPDSSPEAAAEAELTEGQQAPAHESVEFEAIDVGQPRGGGFPLVWMAAAFRRNGLDVRAVEGWMTRGRPFSFAPRGVVFHHTASGRKSGPAPSLAVCVHGRSDLPGPLCHVLVGRDGTAYVIAAGRANHAGLGGPWRNVPKDSGNSYLVGVEVENDGVGEAWSDAQLAALDRLFATLLVGLQRKESWLCGHKEWAPDRKIDPGHIDMSPYRTRIRGEIRRMARHEASATTGPGGGATQETGHAGPGEQPGPGPEPGPGPQPGPGPEPAEGVYAVRAGDTLWSISRRHAMTVGELKQLNGLTTNLIHPGDRLKVRSGTPPADQPPADGEDQ